MGRAIVAGIAPGADMRKDSHMMARRGSKLRWGANFGLPFVATIVLLSAINRLDSAAAWAISGIIAVAGIAILLFASRQD